MVEYKTPGEIDAMHAAGQVVASILAAVRDQAAPGVRLAELDATARDVLADARATSPFLGYQPAFADTPFPAVICASVNDAALHDIPGRYRLKDGDLLSIDCGATLDGWTGDAAVSLTVGQPVPARDAVQRRVVDRGADDRGERHRGEAWVVTEERRDGAGPGQHVPGDLVQFGQPHPRPRPVLDGREDLRDHLPGGAHRLDLSLGLDLHHGPAPPLAVCPDPAGVLSA